MVYGAADCFPRMFSFHHFKKLGLRNLYSGDGGYPIWKKRMVLFLSEQEQNSLPNDEDPSFVS
jgi:hypothetical protein